MADDPKPEISEEEAAKKASITDNAKAITDAAAAIDATAADMLKPGADTAKLAKVMQTHTAHLRLAVNNTVDPPAPVGEGTGGASTTKAPVAQPQAPAKT